MHRHGINCVIVGKMLKVVREMLDLKEQGLEMSVVLETSRKLYIVLAESPRHAGYPIRF